MEKMRKSGTAKNVSVNCARSENLLAGQNNTGNDSASDARCHDILLSKSGVPCLPMDRDENGTTLLVGDAGGYSKRAIGFLGGESDRLGPPLIPVQIGDVLIWIFSVGTRRVIRVERVTAFLGNAVITVLDADGICKEAYAAAIEDFTGPYPPTYFKWSED